MTRLLRRVLQLSWRDTADERAKEARAPIYQLSGRVIGGFEFLEVIGEGGMGVVYRAIDLKLERDVAIKVLFSGSDETVRKRLLAEARAAAAVSHPNVAAVYGVGESEGFAYVIMELIHGISLGRLLKSRSIEPRFAVMVAKMVAAALAAAHRQSIIHLDIKPTNIMINADGIAKVLDFGIASRILAKDESAVLDRQHPPETIAGTRGYTAPERWEGMPASPAMDIYSYGIVLRQMLTNALSQRHSSWRPGIMNMRKSFPASSRLVIDGVLKRCIARDPGQRFQNGAELLAALQRLEDLPRRRSTMPAIFTVAIVILVTAVMVRAEHSDVTDNPPQPTLSISPALTRLTAEPLRSSPEAASISPGGDRIALVADSELYVVDNQSRDTKRIDQPDDLMIESVGWFPDGRGLLAVAADANGWGLWKLTLATSTWTRWDRRRWWFAEVSPNGEYIAAVAPEGAIWLAKTQAGAHFELAASRIPGAIIRTLAWSPDSRHLAYVRTAIQSTLELLNIADRTARTLMTDQRLDIYSRRSAVTWRDADTLVVARRDDESFGFGSELWSIPIASDLHQQRLLSRLSVAPFALSASRSGKRIALLALQSAQMDTFIATLTPGQDRISELSRLTYSEFHDYPSDWDREGRILFSSDRSGHYQAFAQLPNSNEAQRIMEGSASWPKSAIDGTHFYWRASGEQAALVRSSDGDKLLSVERGWINELPSPSTASVHCADRAPVCMVLREQPVAVGPSEGRFSYVDDLDTTLFTAPVARYYPSAWAISPDGKYLAVESRKRTLLILEMPHGQVVREVHNPMCTGAIAATWMADGGGVFFTTSACNRPPRNRLMAVRFGQDDDAVAMHTLVGKPYLEWLGHPTSSPDGRYVAFGIKNHDSDVWLLEFVE